MLLMHESEFEMSGYLASNTSIQAREFWESRMHKELKDAEILAHESWMV